METVYFNVRDLRRALREKTQLWLVPFKGGHALGKYVDFL